MGWKEKFVLFWIYFSLVPISGSLNHDFYQIFDRWKPKHYPNSLGTSSYRRLPNISQYSLLAFYAILLNRSLHFFDQFLSQTSSHPFPVIIPDILKYEVLAVGPYISQCYSSFHSRNILIFQIWRSIIPRHLYRPRKDPTL